jgi:hypothetical protein
MATQVFVNTRFNIVLREEAGLRDVRGGALATEAWLAQRFDLFEQVCLPSLAAQTCSDFTWLVFFSHRTPQVFRERIEGIRRAFPAFTPCFLVDFEQQAGRYQAEAAARLRPGTTHVITARIDNDDAFHRTFLERAVAEARGEDDAYINFPNGIQFDMDRGVAVAVRKPSNPFVVRAERVRNGTVRTVLEVMHHHAQDTGLLRDAEYPPLWLQTIHGRNMQNRLLSGSIRPGIDLRAEFGMRRPPAISMVRSLGVALRYYAVQAPLNYMRAARRRLG